MPTKPADPTEPLRVAASGYPGVDRGTACTQSSFKANKKAFLFTGPQGGRYKAMFKLGDSLAEARELAVKEPDRFDAGKTGWVTARFTADKPMPTRLWKRWLDESYAIATGGKPAATTKENAITKKNATAGKNVTKKTATRKATAKQAPSRKAAKAPADASGAELIDAQIAALGDWRGEILARVRTLIKQADPGVIEETKWRKPSNPAGVPVWSHDGIICTGETYKDKVKLTFAKGAALDDPAGLFNASLTGNARRAIDIHEGDTIKATAFKALIREAVALNTD